MKRKIYISINILESDKKRLTKAVSEWKDLPVKWVKESNYHLTLAYLGHVNDEDMVEICRNVREAVLEKEIFDLHFSKIKLNSEKDPKMVWFTGEASQELLNLQESIEKSLGIFIAEKKVFSPHIILGKIRKHKWEELEEMPKIEKELNFSVTVDRVDVMASDFENEGQEYSIVESCQLDG